MHAQGSRPVRMHACDFGADAASCLLRHAAMAYARNFSDLERLGRIACEDELEVGPAGRQATQ